MKRNELIGRLATQILTLNPGHPLRVAVDGVDAAGKTSLADELAETMTGQPRMVIRASVDDFLNLKRIRRQQGQYSPQGFYEDSYNYPALFHDLLMPLGPGGNRQYRTAAYDAENDSTLDLPYITAPENAILILDGIFLLRPELVPLLGPVHLCGL